MRNTLIETLKIVNGVSNYGRHFLLFFFKLEIYCQDKSQYC